MLNGGSISGDNLASQLMGRYIKVCVTQVIKWGVYLSTSAQQFGFKRYHSGSNCSFVLKETIDYYVKNGNKVVHTCALDLSKAYDRVQHFKLFRKLLERGLPEGVVRLLVTWYSSQSMQIKWKNQTSEAFGLQMVFGRAVYCHLAYLMCMLMTY